MNYSIEGTVVDAAGSPVPAVVITLLESPGEVPDLGMLTDEQGTFSIDGLTMQGDYRLRFIGPSGRQVDKHIMVQDSVTRVEIRIQ